ncbi:MAG: hypothetical protein K2Y21_03170 [Phycisphaerales bacterium]|nr:hypothetical protein [Phycisphaerales bacterium]
MNSSKTVASMLVLAGALSISPAIAQQASIGPVPREASARQAAALGKMMKTISVEYAQTPLESVLKNLADVTGAPLEIAWRDDRNPTGLDKEALINFKAENQTALSILERALAQAQVDGTLGGNTWQLSEEGVIEVGPKERLNRTRRIEIYDISDLLLVVRDYSDVPQFDLNASLQAASSGGGGGGGQSPFSGGNQNQNNQTGATEQQRADEVIRLITELIESEQWTANGGNAANITYYKKQMIVTAPDYIHRQLAGYPFVPNATTRVEKTADGKRIVTFEPGRRSGIVQTGKVTNTTPADATVSNDPADASKK